MKQTIFRTRPFAVIALLLVVTLACQFLTLPSTPTAPAAPSQPDQPAQPDEPDKPGDPTRVKGAEFKGELVGPGSFSLPDPAAALEALDNYIQVFDYTIEATFEGQPNNSATHIECSVVGSEWNGALTSESSGADPIS